MSLPRLYNDAKLPPLRLPSGLLANIHEHAQQQGETLSDFVRRALRDQLRRDGLTQRLAAAREAFRHEVFVNVTEEGKD